MSSSKRSVKTSQPEPTPPPDSEGWKRILDERERQQMVEGFTVEYDRKHPDCRLFHAAEAYALPPAWLLQVIARGLPCRWWLPSEMWKPSLEDHDRNLEKAGALYLAEWERQVWAGHASTAARMRAKAIACAKKIDRSIREVLRGPVGPRRECVALISRYLSRRQIAGEAGRGPVGPQTEKRKQGIRERALARRLVAEARKDPAGLPRSESFPRG